jgi:hypothetical protein
MRPVRAAVAAAVALAGLALAGLALPDSATAAGVVERDREGRPIHFDVRAGGVDVGWYAGLLRDAAHSDEISRVTIRIVSWDELAETCGRHAAGCYSSRRGRDLVVVPAGQSRRLAHTLIHEYGHHVDAQRRHGGLREPNGTPLWWRARGMAELVDTRSVARSYRIAWDRSIGEVFAEDYAYVNLGGPYRIRWLLPPTDVVRAAIRADLGLQRPPAIDVQPPARRPVVLVSSGTLDPQERASLPFGLLGPNRRVTFTATFIGPGRLSVECNGSVRTRSIASGLRSATLDVPRIGPGECRAVLLNTGPRTGDFRLRLRLSIRD